jgi:hypothetical protein
MPSVGSGIDEELKKCVLNKLTNQPGKTVHETLTQRKQKGLMEWLKW